MDVIEIREFDGEAMIDEQGQPIRERVVRIVARRTGKVRRMERNALLSLDASGQAVVSLGNREQARAAAAIVSWEGPGFDGQPVTVEALDELEVDAFMDRVYKEIEARLGERGEAKSEGSSDPKPQRTTQQPTAPSYAARPATTPAPGPSNMSNVPNGSIGRLIKLTD